MAATITYDTGTTVTFSTSSIANLKTPLAAIGLTASMLEVDTATNLIYKVTKGTGTYADTYLRLYVSSSDFSMQIGTGLSGSTLTGAGTARRFAYSTQPSFYVRTILTSDGTFGLAQFYKTSDTNVPAFQIGYVQATNTAITATTIPLTAGLISTHNTSSTIYPAYHAHNGWKYNNYNAGFIWYANSTGSSTATNQYGLGYMESVTRLGTRDYYMLGCTGEGVGRDSSTHNGATSVQLTPYAVNFGLQFAEGSSQGVIPNVPIFSGGRIMGYNSNLVFCSPDLAIGDRIVVNQGSEEYVKIDSHGIAVRQV
jgi:hypothetical protein